MPELMDDKVALVTGAGSGIGRATALAFAQKGAKLVVADRMAPGGEQTVQLIHDLGGDAFFVPCDVSKAPEVEELIHQIIERYGLLDYAHNNAGIAFPTRDLTADIQEKAWDLVVNVNLKGVWLCMKHEIIQMLKQGSGAIVNTASVAGLAAIEGTAAYVASKHGVAGLTKTAALEYAKAGIRVNAVCPGYINTPYVERAIMANPQYRDDVTSRHPIGRVGRPEEIAAAVVWLCSDAAAFVTGHVMPVDGGYMAQ